MIKVLAIDDSDEYLDSLVTLFGPYKSEFDLVGTFSNVSDADDVEEVLDEITIRKPDIVLMDFSFAIKGRPDDFGVELTRKIIRQNPSQKAIMLVGDDDDADAVQLEKIRRSFQAGATAYLRKRDPHLLFMGIKETHHGHRYVGPQFADLILNSIIAAGDKYKLSPKEIEVLTHLANDMTLKQVADQMGIGYDGVNFHVGNARTKLEAKTLQGLIAKAYKIGIIW